MEIKQLSILEIDSILRNVAGFPATTFPFYTLDQPGMPDAGPDVLEQADALLPLSAWKELDISDNDQLRCWLINSIYLRMLYSSDYVLRVVKSKNSSAVERPAISGHVWGAVNGGPVSPDYHPVVMVVGKQPGVEELRDQRNFVGPSGLLLQRTITKLGYDHCRDWYVTNIVRWPMPNFHKGQLPQRWIKDCSPLLENEFRLVKPDYILCLGSEATKRVLSLPIGVSDMFGRVETLRIPLHRIGEDPRYHEAKVMASIHPAFVLRSTENLPKFEASIASFLELVGTGGVSNKSPALKFRYVYRASELSSIVDDFLSQPGIKRVAVDAEWEGSFPADEGAYVRTIQFSYRDGEAIVVVLRAAGGHPVFLPGQQAAATQLTRMLIRDDVQLVGHFISADIPWLEHFGVPVSKLFRKPSFDEFCTGFWSGIFDTGHALHAFSETADFKLEVAAARNLGVLRWDVELLNWKKEFCAQRNIKLKELEGYGECSDEVLLPYAGADAARTFQLADLLVWSRRLLDRDLLGNNCWRAFYTSTIALGGFVEMGSVGIKFDFARNDELAIQYSVKRAELLGALRDSLNWPDFNPASTKQCVSLLFGDSYVNKRDEHGQLLSVRPAGVACLGLTPVKATNGDLWTKIVALGQEHQQAPSVDKEVLGALVDLAPVVAAIRDIRTIDSLLSKVLSSPEIAGDICSYQTGLASFVRSDGRIHSRFTQVKETGRASSSDPNVHNLPNKMEAHYARILGDQYKHPVRTVIISDHSADEPKVFVKGDYSGAELLILAVMCRDDRMIDHCLRSGLPENHPNYYDIHSNIAVRAFALDCAPTKTGLKSVGKKHLRVAAKGVIFRINYGGGDNLDAIVLAAKQEGEDISVDDARRVRDQIFVEYPGIAEYQDSIRRRVADPGWIATAKGRYRRVIDSSDRSVHGGLERELLNFPMQGLVADLISEAISNLYYYPVKSSLGYRITLQVHDELFLETPVRSLDEVCNNVMPQCMVSQVSFKACDLNGRPYANSEEYRFSVCPEVVTAWGQSLTVADCRRLGISESYIQEAE